MTSKQPKPVKATAAELLGRRALSKGELERRLTRQGASQEEAREASDWLEDIGAIDDADYAGMVARQYARRGYGPGRVREELRRRGVPRELWDAALAELPDPAEAIDGYIAKKRRDGMDGQAWKRIAGGLLRRGFRWEDVRAGLARHGETVED